MASDKSKIPLRGIAKLFDHLPAGTRARLESAFAESEDLMDYHNRSAIDQQSRRRLSAYVASPQVTVSHNDLGFDVKWDRLEDRRISFYEIQISLDSVFSAPESYTVVDTCLAIEGNSNTVYVRVRGVRFDGDCGPFSDVQTVEPQSIAGPIIYSRDITDIPAFYVAELQNAYPAPIQRIDISPQRTNGGIMVFGSIGGSINGTFNLTVNDILVQEVGPVDPYGSLAFGPCFVTHSNFYFERSPSDFAGAVADINGTQGSAGTHVGWQNEALAIGSWPSNFPSDYDTDATIYEISGLSRGQGAGTKNIQFTDFGFEIPSEFTILGIKVRMLTAAFMLGTTVGSAASYPQLNTLKLVDGGTARTFSQVDNIPFPGPNFVASPAPVDAYIATFGGATDLWGEVAGFWTAAKINASNFGVDIRGRARYASNSPAGLTQDDKFHIFGVEVTVYAQKTSAIATVALTGATGTESGALQNCTMNAVEFGEGTD